MANITDAENRSNGAYAPSLYDSIPDALKACPQWVCYRLVPNADGKYIKLPYNARTGELAEPNNRNTWVSFDEAVRVSPRYNGIGFVFSEEDPFCGIDLDGCRNPENGQLEPWAYDLVLRFDTYTEASLSGTGVHIICVAHLPGRGRRKGQVEVYDHRHYFCFTGEHLGGLPTEIHKRQEEVTKLYHKHFPPEEEEVEDTGARSSSSLSDDAIIDIARGATNGEKFKQLWQGDMSGYHSHSEADLALCSILAFYCGHDPARINRLFRLSGLYRKKWDRTDYSFSRTITKALHNRHEFHRGVMPEKVESNSSPFADDSRDQSDGVIDSHLVLIPAADVKPEPVSWLWYPYLPLRKLCLLGGDPGLGKTWVALSIAAALSRGHWPFTTQGQPSQSTPGNTIFCVSEDGIADTLVPRLNSFGADLSRISIFVGRKNEKGVTLPITLADEDHLVNAIRQQYASLLIFDPFQRFLPPKAKMNEMETVSPVVSTLMRVAERTNTTILLLGHLNKAKQETLGYKFIGSVDWFAAARSAMMIIQDKENPLTNRFFFQIKNSLAPMMGGVGFSLDPTHLDAPFRWGNVTTVSAHEMANGDSGKKTRAEAAEAFLLRELQHGEVLSDDLMTRAKESGISRNALFEAKKEMGIRASKRDFSGQWAWSLPENTP